MPFGISQTQPDCSTWATVKQEADGSFTTIGCHASKQEAIDQMVVVSLSEDMDPLGEVNARGMMYGSEESSEPALISVDAEDVLETMSEHLLSPRDAALYEAYEAIADEFGQWSQVDAHYVEESPFEADGMICSNCSLFEGGRLCEVVEGDIAPGGICKLWVIRTDLLADGAAVVSEPVESDSAASTGVDAVPVALRMTGLSGAVVAASVAPGGVEVRAAVDLAAPSFMRSSAKRGLALHAEGLSGDGLKPQTVADATKMSDGQISEAKWRKIAPWIARHVVDLEAIEDGETTPGLVAMLLWGGGSSVQSARRAQKYAERIVAQLDSRNIESGSNYGEVDMSTIEWVSQEVDERRSVAYSTLEVRAVADGTKVVGYAAIFDSPSEPMPFTEFVRRGAFTKTLNDGADVRLLIDHEGVPLARTKSGTLALIEDERGLRVEADLDPMNPDAARIISAMRRGDLSQMSFAFRTIKDAWNSDRSVRELREVQLFDVSIVTFPAYEETVAELRAKSEVDSIPSASRARLLASELRIAQIK
jgi:HK97 family phage prohead protease